MKGEETGREEKWEAGWMVEIKREKEREKGEGEKRRKSKTGTISPEVQTQSRP